MTHHATCQHERYRLTCGDFEELWEHAEGRCEICRKPAAETPDGRLFIDHAQQYGFFAVRGLLCSQCNSLMRYVDRGEKDDHRATAYQADAWFVRVLRARHAENVSARRRLRRATAAESAGA
ncbi:endonuclease domain-containing protein [Streptomyces inhibens]|uniref:endonuclease domain-containing protein n=1 Tax=Streptomyces inhibens TaxID=2293571 RepID=UPI0036B7C204